MINRKIKIGIVTYHKANNYGAVLQAYALYKYLENQGYNAEVVDYWPKYHLVVYKTWNWDMELFNALTLSHKLIYIISFSILTVKRFVRNQRYKQFRKRCLKIGAKEGVTKYDAVFYGSDTIWNVWKQNKLHKGFDNVLWGDKTIQSRYKFSYAPSMGNVIDTVETKAYCSRMLPNFDLISVRETALLNKLKEWGWHNVEKVVDPTILLTKEQWNNLLVKRLERKDYILCYNLENSDVINRLTKRISEEQNLKVIYVTGNVKRTFDHSVKDLAGPMEFLSYFKYASYVFTSSFHGVVFSIIFEKQFCFHSNKETERIISLLSSCGLSDRFIQDDDFFVLEEKIEYEEVNRKLEKIRARSYEYINKCIKLLNYDC